MIIDSSAMLAVILGEADARAIVTAIIESSTLPKMSAASFVEMALKIDPAADGLAHPMLESMISELAIIVLPLTPGDARVARAANLQFGKRRHAARLNFGDCLTYALAKASGEALLFKGNDFSQTDLPRVVVGD